MCSITERRSIQMRGAKAFVGIGHLTELSALRRQLREVTMERDILKKAVGIFSKEGQNGSDYR